MNSLTTNVNFCTRKPALIVTLEYGLFTSDYPGLQFITPKENDFLKHLTLIGLACQPLLKEGLVGD